MQAEKAMPTGPGTGLWRGRLAASLWLASLLLAGRMYGDSITLHPVADTSLFAALPDNNFGASSNVVAGANGSGFPGRILLRFDLSSIPSNAVLQSVTLSMKVVILPGVGGVNSVFDLRRVLTNWVEGTGIGNTGSPANNGESTWNNRFHPYTPWTTPGGAISNDYSATISASLLISGIGSYTYPSSAGLVADVQQWVAAPALNFGWVLISESESTPFTTRRFGTREDPANAPALTVQYTSATTPEISWINAMGSEVQLGVGVSAGQSYWVQFLDSLSSTNWLVLTNLGVQSVTTNIVVVDGSATNWQRFYRLMVQ